MTAINDGCRADKRKARTVVADYAPIVKRVRDYLAAEMDAASPAVVVAYCETNGGEVVELTLSDLVSVTYLAGAAVGGGLS